VHRIAAGYDRIAPAYAEHLRHELEAKPFDREFLARATKGLPAGDVLDLGCGPGHVGGYLRSLGVPVLAADRSFEMARILRAEHPAIECVQCDMRALPYADGSLAGVIAFYAIIHLPLHELPGVFAEMHRVLRPGGRAAVSFHVGDEVIHIEELWGVATQLDFVALDPAFIQAGLKAAGLEILEALQREPYAPGVEAQTQRCYLLAQRP